MRLGMATLSQDKPTTRSDIKVKRNLGGSGCAETNRRTNSSTHTQTSTSFATAYYRGIHRKAEIRIMVKAKTKTVSLLLCALGGLHGCLASPMELAVMTTTLFSAELPENTLPPDRIYKPELVGEVVAPFELPRELPARADVRCKYVVGQARQVQYSVFMSPQPDRQHPRWCEELRKALLKYVVSTSGKPYKEDEVKWKRCRLDHTDGRSAIPGYQADFFLEAGWDKGKKDRKNKYNVESVALAMQETMPATTLDWLDWRGCYEAETGVMGY